MKANNYKICNRCVLDTTAPMITFDDNGNCKYCNRFLKKINDKSTNYDLNELVLTIKKAGKNKKYDCILGLSGGLDSTWALHVLVENGINPLVVHMDNGWNSELAQNNIQNIVEKLNVDLYSHVINWEEYKDLMQSFFDADVLDIELLMDQAFAGSLYNQAKKYNIKYILTGQNSSNEGMGMPEGWNWYKKDKKNILNIWKKFGKLKKIKTYPFFGTLDFLYHKYILKTEWVRFLDYTPFNDQDVLSELIAKYDYKPYKYKHGESVFTRFYQGYILPNKFGFDKRRIHLSNRIITEQISRDEALEILKKSPYESSEDLEDDIEYINKKMGWKQNFFIEYMNRPPIEHSVYGTEKDILQPLVKIKRILKGN